MDKVILASLALSDAVVIDGHMLTNCWDIPKGETTDGPVLTISGVVAEGLRTFHFSRDDLAKARFNDVTQNFELHCNNKTYVTLSFSMLAPCIHPGSFIYKAIQQTQYGTVEGAVQEELDGLVEELST